VNRIGKAWFPIMMILIFSLAYLTVFGWYTADGTAIVRGVKDIRWGMDVSGGVSVTFGPADQTENMAGELVDYSAQVITQRLEDNDVSSYEIYTDKENQRIIVVVPRQPEGSQSTDELVSSVSASARITAVEGRFGTKSIINTYKDDFGRTVAVDSGSVKHRVAVESTQVLSARKGYDESGRPAVIISFSDEGRKQFIESSGRLTAYAEQSDQRYLTVCMDGEPLGEIYVAGVMTEAVLSCPGEEPGRWADTLVSYVNNGALPFELEIMDYELVDAALGDRSVTAMIVAGLIAFVLICIFMIVRYRLPGAVASIALLGQIAGLLAAVIGFIPVFEGFTLTLPGVAGIILSIGMGVDANIITSERIAEEIRKGKTIDGAISAGNENSFSSILDGNVVVLIVAVILMGVFGPPDTLWSYIFRPIMWLFPLSTIGAIYSFGYTLFAGVICNFVMGVIASRIMLRSLSCYNGLRSRWLYGGGER